MKKKLQANIEGFKGKAASLFGVIDVETNVLNIALLASKKQDRKDDCVFITNIQRIDHDFLITESMLGNAINSYFRMKNGLADDNETPLLCFGSKVGSSDPISAIERDGVTETGVIYRISPEMTNAQAAALAMCLYAQNSVLVDDTLEMLNELDAIMMGNWITV